jgi:hypothetical protein
VLSSLLLLLLLLLLGFFVALRLGAVDLPELVAVTLLGALAVAPPITLLLAWIFEIYPGPMVLAGVAFTTLCALVVRGGRRDLRERVWRRPDAPQVLVLAGAVGVGALTWVLHSDAELLISLSSWLGSGEAECFYMQTFELVEELQVRAERSPIRDAWAIISAPGNTVFTASFMPILDGITFRVLDVVFRSLLYLFTFLLIRRWTGQGAVALVAATVCVLNPFVLSVEVLDRNLIAAALSAALLFHLRTGRDQLFVQGWLLGMLATSGLRLLPLCFLISVVAVQRSEFWRPARWSRLVAGVALPFAVGVPHFFEHGLHSLGESEGMARLAWLAVRDFGRTPFVPYPNGPFYLLQLLDLFGVLFFAFVLVGGIGVLQRHRAWAVALLGPLGVMSLVLATQRDWLQQDKVRIALEALVPLVVLAGLGMAEIIRPSIRLWRRFGSLALSILLVFAVGRLASGVQGTPDLSTYLRHSIYQSETPQRLEPARKVLRDFGLLPDYQRLENKLDIPRKRREETLLRQVLFSGEGPENSFPAGTRWWGRDAMEGDPQGAQSGEWVNLEIDLALLITSPEEAVHLMPDSAEFFPWVDLSRPEELLDVYFRATRVPWQPEELTAVVLPQHPQGSILGEVYVELNAFSGRGPDELGFLQVLPVHLRKRSTDDPEVASNSMTALPLESSGSLIRLRVPRETRVLVRDWLIDGVGGTPYRIDSWEIRVVEKEPKVRFLFGEPESYL